MRQIRWAVQDLLNWRRGPTPAASWAMVPHLSVSWLRLGMAAGAPRILALHVGFPTDARDVPLQRLAGPTRLRYVMSSLHHHVAATAQRFRAAGIPQAEAGLDARLLARKVLGWDAAKYLTSSSDTPAPGFEERFEVLIARREAREPMAYILGRQEFWGRNFAVTPAVLIPRPETEITIETALSLYPDRRIGLRIADVGTGSGCLAVTLAAEFHNALVVATDMSGPALAVAQKNATDLGVADRLTFVRADVLGGIPGPFDLVVSNPPYIPDADRRTLQPEVVDHEPAAALFGGADGLDVIRRVVTEAGRALRPSGLLLVEFGVGQADQIAELISATPGLTMVDLKCDLQGILRTVVARAEAPV